MQTVTYTDVKGMEGYTIKCVFQGTKEDDNKFIKDIANIIANKTRKEMMKTCKE